MRKVDTMKGKDSRTFKFVVYGDPIPWKRPGQCRNGRYDTQKSIKNALGLIFSSGMNGKKPLIGRIKLVAIFFMPKPKSFKKNLFDEWHTKRPDLDNCIKFILDAMNGIVYKDDSQVCAIIALKGYSDIPRTDITVTEEFDGEINEREEYETFA